MKRGRPRRSGHAVPSYYDAHRRQRAADISIRRLLKFLPIEIAFRANVLGLKSLGPDLPDRAYRNAA